MFASPELAYYAYATSVRHKTDTTMEKKKYSSPFAGKELIDTLQRFNYESESVPSHSYTRRHKVSHGTFQTVARNSATAGKKMGRWNETCAHLSRRRRGMTPTGKQSSSSTNNRRIRDMSIAIEHDDPERKVTRRLTATERADTTVARSCR